MRIPHALGGRIRNWVWEAGLLLVLPLAFHRGFAEQFSRPKFILTKCLVIAGLAVWALGVLWGRPRRRSRLYLGWPLLSFSLAVLVSCWASPFPRFSLMEVEYALCGPAWALLLTSWSRGESSVRRILFGVGLAGGLAATVTLLQYWGFDPVLLGGYHLDCGSMVPRMRLYSTFGNPNFVGGYLIGAIFAALALATAAARRWAKAFWCALAFTMLSVITVTGSHGAWLGLAVGLAAGMVLAKQKRGPRHAGVGQSDDTGGLRENLPTFKAGMKSSLKPRKAGDLLSLSPSVCLAGAVIILSVAERGVTQIAGRIYLWRFSWPIFWRHPLVGSGWGAYQLLFLEFQGRFLAAHPECVGYWTNNRLLHNDPLQLLLETGLLGLAASIWGLWRHGQQAWATQQLAAGTYARYFNAASVAGVTAILADSLFNYQLTVPPTYILLFTFLTIPGLLCDARVEKQNTSLAAGPLPEGHTRWRRFVKVSLSVAILAAGGGLLWQQARVVASERWYQTAIEIEGRHNLEGAEAAFRRSAGLNGLNGRAHFGLSRALLARGRSAEALQEILQAERTYADSHQEVLRARILEQMGNNRKALAAYRHALWLDPTLAELQQDIDRLSKVR